MSVIDSMIRVLESMRAVDILDFDRELNALMIRKGLVSKTVASSSAIAAGKKGYGGKTYNPESYWMRTVEAYDPSIPEKGGFSIKGSALNGLSRYKGGDGPLILISVRETGHPQIILGHWHATNSEVITFSSGVMKEVKCFTKVTSFTTWADVHAYLDGCGMPAFTYAKAS